MEKITLNFTSPQVVQEIMARDEGNLAALEKAFGVRVVARDNFIRLAGSSEKIKTAGRLLRKLEKLVESGVSVDTPEYQRILKRAESEGPESLGQWFSDRIELSSRRRFVRPQTPHQKKYVDAIRRHEVVIAIGPAGTGKTYLAMAMAVSALLKREFSRLILTRPAREAGEKLGFLPGGLQEKLYPYLRPLYDALYDMLEGPRIRGYEEQGVIEVAPLAFMRGRTFNNSFIILDEAQNTTPEQMKMFLTRLGFNSRAVVTGDITQIDLPRGKNSGLVEIQHILKSVPGVNFVYFDRKDVVRHKIVQKIVQAYEKAEKNTGE